MHPIVSLYNANQIYKEAMDIHQYMYRLNKKAPTKIGYTVRTQEIQYPELLQLH